LTFLRLTTGHWIAFLAALALLLFAGLSWYTTAQGAEARRIERLQAVPDGNDGSPRGSETVLRAARRSAESFERSAWEPEDALGWVIAFGLLASAVLAIIAGFLCAAGRTEGTPGALLPLAGWTAVVTLLAVALELAGAPSGTVIQLGLPLGVAALTGIAAGALLARGDSPSAS
jgi:hypothetical protein